MNYLMPKQGVLSHALLGQRRDRAATCRCSSASRAPARPRSRPIRARKLIGDDEHCWTDDGVFNIEGGCYAKCIHLSAEKEPEIYRRDPLRHRAGKRRRRPGHARGRLRRRHAHRKHAGRYPIEFIPNAKIPCVGGHPKNIILLTCDAFGVLPPVSRLTPEQAMYHFISGYTAKVAGTEVGVDEPRGHVLGLLRRGVPGLASDQVRRDAGRADARPRAAGLAGQHRLDGRRVRRRASASSWRTRAPSSTRSTAASWPTRRPTTIRSSVWPFRAGAGRARRDPASGASLDRPGRLSRRRPRSWRALFHQNFQAIRDAAGHRGRPAIDKPRARRVASASAKLPGGCASTLHSRASRTEGRRDLARRASPACGRA